MKGLEGVRLVALDVGGVLRDASLLVGKATEKAFEAAGLACPFRRSEVFRFRGLPGYTVLENGLGGLYALARAGEELEGVLEAPDPAAVVRAAEKRLPAGEREKALEKMKQAYEAVFESPRARGLVRLVPGAKKAVDAMKAKGYLLAIVSNAAKNTLSRDLAGLGLERFEVVLGREEVAARKPSGAGIRKAMALAGAAPAETLYAGDAPSDIQAARDAGCLAAAVLSGMGTRARLEREKPNFVFRDVTALASALPGRET